MRLSLNFIHTVLRKKNIRSELYRRSDAGFLKADLLRYAGAETYDAGTLYIGTVDDVGIRQCLPDALAIVSHGCCDIAGRLDVSDLLIFTDCDVFSLYYQISEIFNLYNKWEDSIKNIIISGGSLQDIFDCMKLVTRNPSYIMDNSLYMNALVRDDDMEDMSAIWRFQYEHHYWPMEQTMRMVNSNVLTTIRRSEHALYFMPEIFNMKYAAAAIKEGHDFYGYLYIIEVYSKLDDTDLEMLDRFKDLLLMYFKNRGIGPETKSGLYYENIFISAAKGEFREKDDALRKELAIIGWEEDHKFRTVTLGIKSEEEKTDLIYALNSIFSNEIKGKVFYLDGYFNCVFSYRESPYFEMKTQYYINKFSIPCGVSEVFSDLRDLQYYHSQAVFALEYGAGLEKTAGEGRFWHTYGDVFPFHMGMTLKASLQKQRLWSAQLDRLKNYDEEHHTDYVNTLFWYLQEERNAVQTAKRLHLHRNSLQYRLEKINEILELDLADPSVRMRVLLEIYCLKAEGTSSGLSKPV